MCRTWFVSGHSRNSKFATSSGLTQMHSFIFAAVSPSPHRPLRASGRFLNGHAFVMRGLRSASTALRDAGTYVRDIFESLSFVAPYDQRVHSVLAKRESADHELLANCDALLPPGAAALARHVLPPVHEKIEHKEPPTRVSGPEF